MWLSWMNVSFDSGKLVESGNCNLNNNNLFWNGLNSNGGWGNERDVSKFSISTSQWRPWLLHVYTATHAIFIIRRNQGHLLSTKSKSWNRQKMVACRTGKQHTHTHKHNTHARLSEQYAHGPLDDKNKQSYRFLYVYPKIYNEKKNTVFFSAFPRFVVEQESKQWFWQFYHRRKRSNAFAW